jgi:hypothetical protein
VTLALVFLLSVLRLVVTDNVVPSSPILVTLMMEAIRSSETRATLRNVPEDGILLYGLAATNISKQQIYKQNVF